MKFWNFKKQKMEEGAEPPVCNGIDGKYYEPVILNFKKTGEIKIEFNNQRKNNERKKY